MKAATPEHEGVSQQEAGAALYAMFGKIIGYEPTQGDFDFFAWPETFGSTAGPFGGLGGQMVTTFTMRAWALSSDSQFAVVFCGKRIVRVTSHFKPAYPEYPKVNR